jgi:transcriptional regulator with XRE-family HTH domain
MPDMANCGGEIPLIRQKGRVMKYNIAMTENEALRESGRRLAQIRLSRDLAQEELAQRAGVSKRTIERLETGVGGVRIDSFFAVCGALGLTVGFETLLPEVQLSPQDILAKRALPKRARRRSVAVKEWGNA